MFRRSDIRRDFVRSKRERGFFSSFNFILIASLVSIIVYSWGNKHWVTILSVSVVVSIAAFLVGVLLGFIFGFPYSENEKQNKSFKEITEWLTKIIIGLGLVELKKLYHLFNTDVLALSTSLGLGGNHSVLFGALIVAYLIMGFLIGYCLTITEIFKWIVKNLREVDQLRSNVKDILGAVPGPKDDDVTVSSPREGIDTLIESDDLKELIGILQGVKDYTIFDIPELKKLAPLMYKAKQYEIAEKAYEAAYERDKSDFFSLLNAGFILSKKLLRHEASNKLLDKLIVSTPNYGAAYFNKACNYMRMNDFEKAKENITLALTNDATLYAMAEKDEELAPIRKDIREIYEKIRGK